MSDDKNEKLIDGTCFWPLFPFGVARSDFVKFGAGGTSLNIGYCPFRYSNSQDETKKEALYEVNCASNDSYNCPHSSFYKNYHKYFLLWDTKEDQKPDESNYFEKIKDETNVIAIYNIYNNDLEIKNQVLKSLDMFPQPLNILGLGKILEEQMEKIETLRFVHEAKAIHGKFDVSYNDFFKKFYASCDGLQSDDEKNAFRAIAALDAVDKALLNKNSKKCIIFPVLASFYADQHIDTVISIMLDKDLILNSQDRTKSKKIVRQYYHFIAQALGNVLERLQLERQSYLDSWCRRLRQLAANKKREVNDDKKPKGVEDAKNELYQHIGWMIKVLFAKPEVSLIDKFLEKIDSCNGSKDFCIKDINREDHKDRCNTICKFCNKARKDYLEKGLDQTSKLRGRLSEKVVGELHKIADTDPIKSKLLLRGGGGSGKGVVAEDFHAFCMQNIGQSIFTKKESKEIKTVEELRTELNEKQAKELVGDLSSFFENIKDNLENIRNLPPFGDKSEVSSKDIWDFTRNQVAGTSWWLWQKEEEDNELKKLQTVINTSIKHLQHKCTSTDSATCIEQDNCPITGENKQGFDTIFLKMLIAKVAYEYQKQKRGKNANWSFNFFQINCGILGGQGAELTESLKRLFGTGGSGPTGEDAVPGLFQTCSYVGGTLYLDEIADSPVRVQDNLLRPLEEGKVSRPGWDAFPEEVKNIRIVAGTFKNLEKLAALYRQTLPNGDPKGFRPDLLTRLKSNVPVSAVPLWHAFVSSHEYSEDVRRDDFVFVLSQFPVAMKKTLTSTFWEDVYSYINKRITRVSNRASGHLPDQIDRDRHYASRINTRFLNALIARTPEGTNQLTPDLKIYLDEMLDFLLTEVGPDDA